MTQINESESILRATAERIAEWPYEQMWEWEEHDGTWHVIVRNPELEGCMADGATLEEALGSLKEARIEYVEESLKRNMDVPIPAAPIPSREVPSRELSKNARCSVIVDFGSVVSISNRTYGPSVTATMPDILIPALVPA